MVKLRDKKRLNRPPPMYKPIGSCLAVAIHHGGAFVTSPVAKYVGGECLKLDYVVARQLTLLSLRNSIIDWLLLDEVFKIHIIQNGSFKLMRLDDEVTKFCKEPLELREVEFYVDDKDDMRRAVESRIENEEMSGSTERHVECRIEVEDDIEGSNYGEGRTEKEDRQVGEGSNEKLGSEFVTIENFGNMQGRSDTGVDNEESDDLFDSDYDMVEESDDEDDDNLFDANVSTNVELSDEGSEEEPDVVAVEGHCFDESKDSDDEEKDPNYPIFNPEIIFEPSFQLGMLFSSRDEFKLAVAMEVSFLWI